jgi:hypothetical protein
LLRALVLIHTFGALLAFPLNSYCSQQWLFWTWTMQLRPQFLAWPWKFYRALQPLRWLHAYGVFPPRSAAPVKCVVVFQVSWDGETWHECDFKYCPSNPTSAPRFAAPHHPRGDQAMIYETFGVGDGSIAVHGIIGTSNVHAYNEYPLVMGIAQRALEGSPGIVHFLRYPERPDGAPPRWIRAQTYMLEPTSISEVRRTGQWWKRTYIGPHLPATAALSDYSKAAFPEPELWHWENVAWVKRSRFKAVLDHAAAGEPFEAVVLRDARGLSDSDVDRFWGELVQPLAGFDRDDWSSFADLMRQLRERYSTESLRRFARVHGRLSYMLLARLEPFFEASWFRPRIAVRNYFELGMLTSEIIVRGKAAYARAYAEPLAVSAIVPELTVARGLFMTAIFRYEAMVFEAQKLRLLRAIMEPEGRRSTPGEQKMDEVLGAIGQRLFAIAIVTPFLIEQFKGPAYERGYPERYPQFRVLPSAAVVRVDAATNELGSIEPS